MKLNFPLGSQIAEATHIVKTLGKPLEQTKKRSDEHIISQTGIYRKSKERFDITSFANYKMCSHQINETVVNDNSCIARR